MKIKRFVAQDMKQAIRMVREALGEDAVILSNKSVEGGVELTAAVDLEDVQAAPEIQDHRIRSRRQATPDTNTVRPAASGADALADMQQELQKLRSWMQAELSNMSWHDLDRRSPHTRELLARLMGLGLSGDLARHLAEQVSDEADVDSAWQKSLYRLADEIRVADGDALDEGGVIAVVGPTGVGKTTTVAKLAARFALRHGHRQVGLITTDNYRIAARDQLQTYGRILNVSIHAAATPEDMARAMDDLSHCRLVLVDSAGMSGDDERLVQQLSLLEAAGQGLTTLLALSATTEAASLSRAIQLFEKAAPDACVLTKLDEAASLGGSIAALVHSGLPLTYVCDGQRVPEDLHIARAHLLVERAVEVMRDSATRVDQTYVPLAYGGVRNDARI